MTTLIGNPHRARAGPVPTVGRHSRTPRGRRSDRAQNGTWLTGHTEHARCRADVCSIDLDDARRVLGAGLLV